jgi:hypothetical protein
VLLVALAAVAVGKAFLDRSAREPARAALIVLIVFILATAVMTALGRASMGQEQAMAGRYCIAGGVLIVALALLTSLQWGARLNDRTRIVVLMTGALCALMIPIAGLALGQRVAMRGSAELAGQTALVVGVDDERAIGRLSPSPARARRVSDDLRSVGKWHFLDRWSRTLGQHVDVSGVAQCPGVALAAPPSHDFVRLHGLVSREVGREGRSIIVVDEAGIMRGYGRRLNYMSDLTAGLLAPRSYAWFGHARIEAGAWPVLIAYVAAPRGVVCRIGAVEAPSAAPSEDRGSR